MRAHSPESDAHAFRQAWESRNADSEEVFAFEPHYEGSSVTAPLADATPSARGAHRMKARPGHHLAPQPLLDGRMSFTALDQEGYTLFTTPQRKESAGRILHAAERAGVPLKHVVRLGDMAETEYETDFIISRPDQFAAWTGMDDDPDEMMARLLGGRTAPG